MKIAKKPAFREERDWQDRMKEVIVLDLSLVLSGIIIGAFGAYLVSALLGL